MPDEPPPDRGYQIVARYCPTCTEARWFKWRPVPTRLRLVGDGQDIPWPRFGWYCVVCGHRRP